MEQTGGNNMLPTDIESLDIEATMEQTGGNNMLPTDIESLDIIEKQRYLTDKQRYWTDVLKELIALCKESRAFRKKNRALRKENRAVLKELIAMQLELQSYRETLRKRYIEFDEKPDRTSVDKAPDEPPNRKRKINRNGMYTQGYAEGPNQSQESGLWGRFVGTTRELANMCKFIPKDITSKLVEKCGKSMDTVISMFMNIMREGGKIPEKIAEIMKSAENASLSDKLLGRFAGLIGNGWELLGFELGLSSVDIDHVRADRRESTMMAIYGMLRKWLTSKQEEAKASDLLLAMWKCKKVNVNWSGLATIFL